MVLPHLFIFIRIKIIVFVKLTIPNLSKGPEIPYIKCENTSLCYIFSFSFVISFYLRLILISFKPGSLVLISLISYWKYSNLYEV